MSAVLGIKGRKEEKKKLRTSVTPQVLPLGCALTFASEAKFEIEAKISFRLEAKKMPDFT